MGMEDDGMPATDVPSLMSGVRSFGDGGVDWCGGWYERGFSVHVEAVASQHSQV